MKRLIELEHEPVYYWGLILLVSSCLSLVWALWRDAFKPSVFLTGLLAFSWGYALLWRHDFNERLTSLAAEIGALKGQLAAADGTLNSTEPEPDKEENVMASAEAEMFLPTEF